MLVSGAAPCAGAGSSGEVLRAGWLHADKESRTAAAVRRLKNRFMGLYSFRSTGQNRLHALAQDVVDLIPAELTRVALDDVAGVSHLAEQRGRDLDLGAQLGHAGGQAAVTDELDQRIESALSGIFIKITMPTALLSAQIEMKESRQTVAFLVKLDLRRKHTTTHGEVSRRLLPELKTVSKSVLEPPVQAQISGAASPYTKDCINNLLIA